MWLGLGLKIVNWMRRAGTSNPFNGHTTLTQGLVSYWKLNEQSGVRYDSITASGNNLTDNNTVTYVNQGPTGTAATFTAANSESLGRTNASLVNWPTGDFHLGFWVYSSQDVPAAVGNVISKRSLTQIEWRIQTGEIAGVSDRVYLFASSDGTTEDVQVNLGVGSLPYRQWTFVELRRTGNTIGIAANGGAFTDGTLSSVFNGTAPFQMGCVNATPALFYNGNLDNVGVWNRVLSASERTSIYNTGAGKSYSELTTAEKSGLVSYWNLDETSGTRADSHSSGNDLTDVNTVTSVNTGPAGVAAVFVSASSEYLSRAANTALPNATADMSVAYWVKPPAAGFTAGQAILNYGQFGVAHNWETRTASAGGVFFDVWDATPARIASGSVTGLVANQWNFVVATVNNATKTVTVYRDTVVGTPASWTVETPDSASRPFAIGGYGGGGGYFDGQIANVGTWTGVLSAAVRTSLFNAGVGKRYASLTAAEKTGLVSYWNLNEVSGSRADASGGGLTLTDNNTVLSTMNGPTPPKGVAANFVRANDEYLSLANQTVWPVNVAGGSGNTLSMWINFADFDTTNQPLGFFGVGNSVRDGTPAFLLNVDRQNAKEMSMYCNGGYADSAVPLVENTWYHVVATVGIPSAGSAPCNVYVNTALFVGPRGASAVGNKTNLYINGGYQLSASCMIDEVGIWSRVLTAQEITDLFNGGAGLYY